ncbi:GntR family transcriptional regulator [Paenibacillus cellulosilyticus]|uniref:GntR family transcriptional regulator n=1 Tax=Paenibacillus cellulosilyticus TaxID=375489 RepID=A0A2V2YXP5_9BACL|nr:GntR family transcriptional regulator [Paenibacillus cellulosilyticus]PWW06517.1 GntR family transcriptional regulator [Paenibacillus cellulosilyticus]QKS46145.1 GntR family transcriptional regulator [Paenibacillus cellulosilyticus]
MKKLALYKQIQEDIMRKIKSGQLRPTDRIPSEQELMDEFKVSKITVKNALTLLADEGLIIRVQGKGTFVSANLVYNNDAPPVRSVSSLPLVGYIIPTMRTRVIQKLVDYTEQFLQEAGLSMVLSITRESSSIESNAIRTLTELGVQGLIVFPTEDEKYNESLLRLSLDKFPCVFIDRYLRNIETYTITSDNYGGAYKAVTHLLSKGHQRIALISPENSNSAIEDRTLGFEKAYTDQGISIDKSLWCHIPLNILRGEQALDYVSGFLQEHSGITAAFTLTEETARLTSAAISSLNNHTTIELLSFDNPHLASVAYVQQDEQEMARTAVKLLREQMDHIYSPKNAVIPVQLIIPSS